MSALTIVKGSETIDGILARDISTALKKEMKRLYYTPRSLAKGLGLPIRVVKFWVNGQGMLSREQYLAICRHLAIDHLDGVDLRRSGK